MEEYYRFNNYFSHHMTFVNSLTSISMHSLPYIYKYHEFHLTSCCHTYIYIFFAHLTILDSFSLISSVILFKGKAKLFHSYTYEEFQKYLKEFSKVNFKISFEIASRNKSKIFLRLRTNYNIFL